MSRSPIRVLMLARAVYPLHGFGGIERHVFHLTTHLVRAGVDVRLVVGTTGRATPGSQLADVVAAAKLEPKPDQGLLALRTLRYDRTTPLLRPNGILGRQINYPIFALAEGRLAAHLAAAQALDIVHSQGLAGWGVACLRPHHAALGAVPFVANPHGLEEYRTGDWRKRLAYAPFRALYSRTHRAADRVIATDGCTQDDLPHYLGVDPARVVVVPSAIDVAECLAAVVPALRQAARDRWGLATADPVLLSVGRIERNKGMHVLLAALATIRAQLGPHWRWLLVGTGTAQPALAAQAAALGLAEHVVFVGALNDQELHSLYEEVDLFVHPTLYEGSSLVTLEAMIHGLPVVASAAGGIPDKVFPGRNGLLVPPGDEAALAAALRTALAQRTAWPDWGRAGQAIVRATFDWPIVAGQTKALYERMLTDATLAHARA